MLEGFFPQLLRDAENKISVSLLICLLHLDSPACFSLDQSKELFCFVLFFSFNLRLKHWILIFPMQFDDLFLARVIWCPVGMPSFEAEQEECCQWLLFSQSPLWTPSLGLLRKVPLAHCEPHPENDPVYLPFPPSLPDLKLIELKPFHLNQTFIEFGIQQALLDQKFSELRSLL